MAFWLLKTEPGSYGWADLVVEGTTEWTGVRNNAAAAHLRRMAPGDQALIYHSGAEKAAVGVAEITRAARQDSDDPRWVSVAIRAVTPLARPVPLSAMKADPALATTAMLRQPRLSVSPLTDAEWHALTVALP